MRVWVVRIWCQVLNPAWRARQVLFDSRAVDNLVPIKDMRPLFMEMGYYLGSEAEGARIILDASGLGEFTFRDLVSWWTQSTRSWLSLLDDVAFKVRQSATEVFLRNDPQRTGRVTNEKLTGLIKGLRASLLTKKTEQACKRGSSHARPARVRGLVRRPVS